MCVDGKSNGTTQNPVGVTLWGFDSPLRHHPSLSHRAHSSRGIISRVEDGAVFVGHAPLRRQRQCRYGRKNQDKQVIVEISQVEEEKIDPVAGHRMTKG